MRLLIRIPKTIFTFVVGDYIILIGAAIALLVAWAIAQLAQVAVTGGLFLVPALGVVLALTLRREIRPH